LHHDHLHRDLKTPSDVIRKIKDCRIERVDLRFTDVFGQWRRFRVRPTALDLKAFEEQGGCIRPRMPRRGPVLESEAVIAPDPQSAFLDPFAETPTLVMICSVRDSANGEGRLRDSRSIAQRTEAFLQTTSIGGAASFRLELQCPGPKAPRERDEPLRRSGLSEDLVRFHRPSFLELLEKSGVEIDNRRTSLCDGENIIVTRAASMTRTADALMTYAYVVRNVAPRDGKAASFAGGKASRTATGMRVHQSIWRAERPLFAGDGHSGASAIMRHYAAGLIEHAPALIDIIALTNGSRIKSAPCTSEPAKRGLSNHGGAECCISITSPAPEAMGVVFHSPNARCNPYLAFAAMLLAGIDGFNYRMYNADPDQPLADFFASRSRAIARAAPADRASALDADREFLLAGRLFASDLIAMLVGKRPQSGDRLDSHV
jgi:glutamine synthetase